MNEKITEVLFNQVSNILDKMKKNPESVTEKDRSLLSSLYSKICKPLGISEHCRWEVKWQVEKWFDTARKVAGFEPDEVLYDTQNIVVDGGAELILKLVTGRQDGAHAYDEANAKIIVGTDSTGAVAGDTQLKGTTAESSMERTYPQVSSRSMIFRSSFADGEANFEWREIGVSNGTTLMNRKVVDMGRKQNGTWTVQLTITLTSE